MSLYSCTSAVDFGLFWQYITYIWSLLSCYETILSHVALTADREVKKKDGGIWGEGEVWWKVDTTGRVTTTISTAKQKKIQLTAFRKTDASFSGASSHFSSSFENVLHNNREVLKGTAIQLGFCRNNVKWYTEKERSWKRIAKLQCNKTRHKERQRQCMKYTNLAKIVTKDKKTATYCYIKLTKLKTFLSTAVDGMECNKVSH